MSSRIVKETYTDDFAGRVRRLRDAANLTQPALARILGISVSYINLIESGGRTNPTIDTVDRVCVFFGVTREWLLDGKAPMFTTEDAQAARDRYFALLREKLGSDKERELREQKVLAEVAVRLAQAPYADEITWNSYRKQIIDSIDAYAAHLRASAHEIKQAGLKLARSRTAKPSAKK